MAIRSRYRGRVRGVVSSTPSAVLNSAPPSRRGWGESIGLGGLLIVQQ
jgi:hypothetical protein